MNSLANRFSTTGHSSELKRAQAFIEGEEFVDSAWGSEAGFGSLAKGVPNFTVPSVPDVSTIVFRNPNNLTD